MWLWPSLFACPPVCGKLVMAVMAMVVAAVVQVLVLVVMAVMAVAVAAVVLALILVTMAVVVESVVVIVVLEVKLCETARCRWCALRGCDGSCYDAQSAAHLPDIGVVHCA